MSEEPAVPRAFAVALEDLLDALRVEAGLARNTLVAYRRDLEAFGRWAGEAGLKRPEQVEPDHLVAFMGSLRAAGRAPATLARGLVSLRILFRHLVTEGELQRDPTARVPAPRLQRYLPGVLSPEEVAALLGACDGPDPLMQRDRALLEMASLLDHYSIPGRLRSDILAFHTHYLENHVYQNHQHALVMLPDTMQEKIKLYVRIKLIQMVPMFKGVSDELQIQLASSLDQRTVDPHTVMIRATGAALPGGRGAAP